jgi:NAD(P)-dependent dehydrogenase (short-subunit alcohol dehydrogenase family)
MIDTNHYGPWAVIAGGSEGVGSAFADSLAQAGIDLVLIARKSGPLEETANKVRAHGVQVGPFRWTSCCPTRWRRSDRSPTTSRSAC